MISEFGTLPMPRKPPTSVELVERFLAAAEDIDRFGPKGVHRLGIKARTIEEAAMAATVLRWCANHVMAFPPQGIA